MLYITKLKLAAVHQLCNANDKSTEYLIMYMQDTCNVNLDCVNSYIALGNKEHNKLFKDVNDFTELMSKLCE